MNLCMVQLMLNLKETLFSNKIIQAFVFVNNVNFHEQIDIKRNIVFVSNACQRNDVQF